MVFFSSTFGVVISSLIGLGILAGGMGYLISSFRGGGNKLTSFWKEQADGYKLMMVEKDRVNDEKFQVLHKEIGELNGRLNAEQALNERLEKIFQNRNPEMDSFMKGMVDSMGQIGRVLSEIHTMTKAEHERDFQISATVTKTP